MIKVEFEVDSKEELNTPDIEKIKKELKKVLADEVKIERIYDKESESLEY
ncbi:MAG: hypothetical protein ACFE75_08835 [Candidatus Hodarchaeota archaeon]